MFLFRFYFRYKKYSDIVDELRRISEENDVKKVLIPGGLAIGASYAITNSVINLLEFFKKYLNS